MTHAVLPPHVPVDAGIPCSVSGTVPGHDAVLVLLFLSLCALYYYSPFQRTYPLDRLLNDVNRWLNKVFLE